MAMKLWQLTCLVAGAVAAKAVYDYLTTEERSEREKALAVAAIALGVIPVVLDYAILAGQVD